MRICLSPEKAVRIAHELDLAADVIVINRFNVNFPALESLCCSSGLPILLRIPLEGAIAEGIA